MRDMSIRECAICRKLPATISVNLREDQSLPALAYKLKNGDKRLTNPYDSGHWRVECPNCGRRYDFVSEKSLFEWKLHLHRIKPEKPSPEIGQIKITKRGSLAIPAFLITELGYDIDDSFSVQKTRNGMFLKKVG